MRKTFVSYFRLVMTISLFLIKFSTFSFLQLIFLLCIYIHVSFSYDLQIPHLPLACLFILDLSGL